MNMKKNMLKVLVLALAGLPVAAMAADFSGAWARDASQSEPAAHSPYWLSGPGAAQNPGFGRGGEQIMTVKQTGTSFEVTMPPGSPLQGSVQKYTINGKTVTQKTDTWVAQTSVTAGMQGNDLVITTVQPYGGMPGNATLEQKDVWTLSPDSKTLTITTTRTLPAGTKTTKQVFTRK
jgi:hypothetical protein